MSLKEQVIYSDSYLANPHYEFNHVILDMPPKRYEAKAVGESRDSVDSQSYLLENSHQKSNTRFLSACPFLCLHFMGYFCGRKSTSCEQERSRLGKKEQPLITNQQEKILLRDQ
ncbi:uncharacterized protein LOC143461619 [Clavelina lepadiformis]|uniref:uncharacterized protein LOC143461619 n=1 Tax=Clavelina lepadiformis TaxID=159417 RepID=UPI004042F025